MCGEYAWIQFFSQSRKGSPPHTWRIPTARKTCRPASGITSTYVENTKNHYTKTEVDKDHLHIRGEYGFPRRLTIRQQGSPPHTWRILTWSSSTFSLVRITSTYVENTITDMSVSESMWDHLHIRGEYQIILKNDNGDLGSPPHTWRILNDPRYINIPQSK